MGGPPPEYQLGSDTVELERLNRQGNALAPATRILLAAAGVEAGMRVLDLGCGVGDVSFVAAELVGGDGEIVGVDQAPDPVAQANRRAAHGGHGNVHFVVGDIHEPAEGGPYDAVIGRLVLMYLPDPAAVLRAQAAVLRPGGVIVPIEFDLRSARVIPETPVAGRALTWLNDAFTQGGIEPALGPRLWQVSEEAGLRPRGMLGVQPHFGPDDPDGPALFAGIVRAVLPLILATGVATAAEVDVDTLESRLAEEFSGKPAVLAHPALYSAWSTRGDSG